MSRFDINRNDKTSLYEVHAAGCRHSHLPHMENMVTVEGDSAAAVAREFEAQNEGCLAKVAPCAKKV